MQPHRKSPVNLVYTETESCSIDLRLNILGRLPFFSGLDQPTLQTINSQFREVGFEAGEFIFWEGTSSDYLYVLADGKVKLKKAVGSQRDVLLDVLGSGDFFGNIANEEGGVHFETAQAMTACCVLILSNHQFRATLRSHPDLMARTASIMASRLRQANQKLLSFGAMSVDQRLASTLLALESKFGLVKDGMRLIDLPLSRDDLAEMTGTTPETVSRWISQMRGAGVLRTGRKWTGIVDLERLKALAEGGEIR